MIKVGFGYDLHKISKHGSHRVVKLFTVPIATKFKVIAHSDGDVGLHALADAILGAVGAEDIGTYFPESKTPPNFDSRNILKFALMKIAKLSYKINNIDIMLISDEIIISKYKLLIKLALVKITGLDAINISIKASTSENTKTLCLRCYAVVLISQ